MNYSLKQLAFTIFFLMPTVNISAQDTLGVSGVVLNPISISEGNLITPEPPLPTLFDNIRVSQDVTNWPQMEVSIDINQIDPDNIVAAWIDYSYDHNAHVAYGYSFDGGQTWVDELLPTNLGGYPYQGDPAVAADKEGNFYISFISFYSGVVPYIGAIYVAKSTDGGITFPENMIIRLDDDDVFDDKSYIAIDRTNNETANNIYVAWTNIMGTSIIPNEIHFASSTDLGENF